MKYRLVEEEALDGRKIYFVERRSFLSPWETVLESISVSYSTTKEYYDILRIGRPIKYRKVLCNQ